MSHPRRQSFEYPPMSESHISQNKSCAALKYPKPNDSFIRNRCLIQKKCHKTRFSTVMRWRCQLCHYHSELKANYILRRQTWIEKLCILMRYDDPRATNLLELTKPLATTRCVLSIVPGLLARPLRIRARQEMKLHGYQTLKSTALKEQGKCSCWILANTQDILSEAHHDFPQYLQTNSN
jgi:hypothetical protein